MSRLLWPYMWDRRKIKKATHIDKHTQNAVRRMDGLKVNTMDVDDLRHHWKIEIPRLMDDVDVIFADSMTDEFWEWKASQHEDTEPEYAKELRTREDSRQSRELTPKATEDTLTSLPHVYYCVQNCSNWILICAAVQYLCRYIGVPGAEFSKPVHNLKAIQSYYLEQELRNQDTLRDLYSNLLVRYQEQKRVIGALSYRHILENLPGPEVKGKSSTAKWINFWNDTMDAAVPLVIDGKGHKTTQLASFPNPNHPFVQAVTQLEGTHRDKIISYGNLLYSGLSSTIHAFHDALEPPDTYDIDQKIMNALKPIHFKTNDNGQPGKVVDWEKERERFFVEKSASGGGVGSSSGKGKGKANPSE